MEPVAEGATKFQHTAARRRLPLLIQALILPRLFQHTAARRRLPAIHSSGCFLRKFQHTAARRRLPTGVEHAHHIAGFNTQPRGGGCCPLLLLYRADILFQHTAARRRLLEIFVEVVRKNGFQHTAARRRLLLENNVD